MANDPKNHEGAGDPGGVDPGTPVPGEGAETRGEKTKGESRADVEAAFGGRDHGSDGGKDDGSDDASDGGSSDLSKSDSRVDQLVARAGAMKDRASAVSGEISGIERDGEAAGGMVRARVDGAGNLKSVKIDPSLMDGEPAVLEELIVNAVQSAKAQVAEEAAGKVSELVGGLPIPQSVAGLLAQFLPKK